MSHGLLAVLVLRAAASGSPEDAIAFDAQEARALAEMRMAELGIEPVLMDDGESYYYALPEHLETPESMQDGALFYVYDGQQVYSPSEWPSVTTSVVGDYHLTDISHDVDAYLGVGETVKVDAYGRRWLLAGADVSALEAEIAAHQALVKELYGDEPDRAPRLGIEWDDRAGEVETSFLDTDIWVLFDCDSDADAEVYDHIYGGTTSGLDPYGPPNVRQKKIVFFQGTVTGTGTLYRGSGVLVDDDTVLTAAHVIADGNGYGDQVNMRVCTFGNVESGAQCRSVVSLVTPGGTHDGTVNDDYGLIELSSPFSPTVGWMALSTASDSVLAGATHFHEGYSSWQPTCDPNSTSNDADLIVDGFYLGFNYGTGLFQNFHYLGSWLLTAYGPTHSVVTGNVRFKVSSASAMSGSPYYYCPSGCTSTSGAHFITAITHGHSLITTTSGYTNGVKARDIEQWVIANK